MLRVHYVPNRVERTIGELMNSRPARRTPALLAWGAAAVAIVIAGTLVAVIVRGAPGGGVASTVATAPAPVQSTGVPAAARVPAAAGTLPAPGSVPVTTGAPEYYVSTDTEGNLMATDTVTGQQIARVPSPDGYQFTGVTAAADDRTFVVVASTATERRSWFRVTLDPGSAQPLRLTQLPVPSVFGDGAVTDGFALSGSGTELAVALHLSAITPANQRQQAAVEVYSVATGTLLRDWSTTMPSGQWAFGYSPVGPSSDALETNALTWVEGDRAVVFPVKWHSADNLVHVTMRRLDLYASGSDLLGGSRVIWSQQGPADSARYQGCDSSDDPLVSADGKTVSCWSVSEAPTPGSNQKKLVDWTLTWQVYFDTVPGAPRDVFRKTFTGEPVNSIPFLNVVWTDTAGGTVLGFWSFSTGNVNQVQQGFGTVSASGRFQDLPRPAQNVGPGTVKGIAW